MHASDGAHCLFCVTRGMFHSSREREGEIARTPHQNDSGFSVEIRSVCGTIVCMK